MTKVKKSAFVAAGEFMSQFSPADRAAIDARTKVLIAEELTLRDLRKARDLTQAQIGAVLGIGQEHVSRLEQRSDLLLSTLAGCVAAMGGRLRLVATFPDRPPVELTGLAEVFETDTLRPVVKARRKRAVEVAAG